MASWPRYRDRQFENIAVKNVTPNFVEVCGFPCRRKAQVHHSTMRHTPSRFGGGCCAQRGRSSWLKGQCHAPWADIRLITGEFAGPRSLALVLLFKSSKAIVGGGSSSSRRIRMGDWS
jgi:hypothetical protein